MSGSPIPGGRPELRVLRGAPEPDELAALVAVLLSRIEDAPAAAAPPGRPGWARPARYRAAGAWNSPR